MKVVHVIGHIRLPESVILHIYKGAGKDVEPLEMACPQSRGQVINFSRKLVIPLRNAKHASKGCDRKEAK